MQRSDKRFADAHVIIRYETMLVVIGTREMTVAEAAELAGLPATVCQVKAAQGLDGCGGVDAAGDASDRSCGSWRCSWPATSCARLMVRSRGIRLPAL
jgi:hypothetical protein